MMWRTAFIVCYAWSAVSFSFTLGRHFDECKTSKTTVSKTIASEAWPLMWIILQGARMNGACQKAAP